MRQPMTKREAALRAVAIAALSGLGVVHLVALPYARLQGPPIAAVCAAAIAASLRVAWSLATAGEREGRAAWRAAVALGVLTCGAFVVTRAVAVPGVAENVGQWTGGLGLVAVALAVSLLTASAIAMAEAGGRAVALRRRAGLRRVVGATAVGLALAPGAAIALVGLGPAPAHHHGLAPNSISAHAFHTAAVDPSAATARFRPGFGGHAGHYVYPNATRPHLPPAALALAIGAAAAFVWLARASLAGRATLPGKPAPPPGPPAPPIAAVTAGEAAPGGRTRRRLRRRSLTLVTLAALAFAVIAADASAHATLVGASPAPLARLAGAPQRIVLRFSEPVQVVRAGDVALLDRGGRRVRAAAGPRPGRAAGRAVSVALRGALAADSYTVRYRVLSADAHALAGALVFSVGGAPLLPPAGRAAAAPSETGAWAVNARFAEIAALGLLLALVTFRGLVWGPALAAASLRAGDRATAARAGRRAFWRAFWCVAAVAGLAEAAVLVVKAALVFGSGVWGSLTTPAAAARLAASSRFGDLLGLRGALLCAIGGLAFWAWSNEISDDAPEQAPGGRRAASIAIAAASATTLGLISAQGHASQAPLPALSVAFDAVHLGAAAVWVGGLACLAVVLRAAPRVLPGAAGAGLGAAVLRRFSRVAMVAVAVIAATGVARAVGELGGPAQLWATPYGRSLLLKSLLLAPVAVLALRNRRAIAGLARGGRPPAAVLRGVWRDVRTELVLAAGIVLVASVLVAQVPGRS
jgi:copper transport protein